MADQQIRQDRDLVLPPGTYAYVLDETKGKISVYVGPFKNSLSNTDKLVVWQDGRFVPRGDAERAIHTFVRAVEGQYIVLNDPAKGSPESFPPNGTTSDATDLDAGRTLVIPGPAMFPLWPGQSAQVIDGHHLRHNQYLVVRVYEPTEAKANMERAVVAAQGGGDATIAVGDLTMGQLIVIKGTDVSFYVPPTGIEVVPEPDGNFVREAPTLEQLEYSVLRDENGNKRFERGPAVVFPEPTETFVTDPSTGSRKFRAIELNPQSGLYIKVIAAYTDDDGVEHREGEELFLTGEETPIYFPRVEHSIIQYGAQRKHHAVAVPTGEGRYLLDRTTGEVDLVEGPRMLLPDPRTEVVVRRVLDPREVAVMYPGNSEALAVNLHYEDERKSARGDFLMAEPDVQLTSAVEYSNLMASTPVSAFGGEKMRRGTEYTPPRMITLDTKYDGAVGVSVWPGYAILVMDKVGKRRVEVGPKNILLAYDESLMGLSLSTGRPKDDRSPLKTVYLRTINNAVSDRVTVETRDLVPVTIDLSLRVNFEGDADERWFDVEDYVALLTDHCRSKLRNVAKRHGIREFYGGTIDFVRDALLGESVDGERPGLPFKENSMRLYDVEVLAVRIDAPEVGALLTDATNSALTGAIELAQAEDEAERDARRELLRQERILRLDRTAEIEAGIRETEIQRHLRAGLARAAADLSVAEATGKVLAEDRAHFEAGEQSRIDLDDRRNAVVLARLEAEIEQSVKQLSAVSPDLVAALQAFGDKSFVSEVVSALGPAALASGVTSADMLGSIFRDTPFQGITDALSQRPLAVSNGSHD